MLTLWNHVKPSNSVIKPILWWFNLRFFLPFLAYHLGCWYCVLGQLCCPEMCSFTSMIWGLLLCRFGIYSNPPKYKLAQSVSSMQVAFAFFWVLLGHITNCLKAKCRSMGVSIGCSPLSFRVQIPTCWVLNPTMHKHARWIPILLTHLIC